MTNYYEKILEKVSRIQSRDKRLGEEFEMVRHNDEFRIKAADLSSKLHKHNGTLESMGTQDAVLETIVLRVGRPVLSVFENEAVLEFRDSESEVWKDRLLNARPLLMDAIKSVGRIELENHPDFVWVGTGWLVDKDRIITNRHVASVFARNNGQSFVFRQGNDGGLVRASVDFLEEAEREAELSFKIISVIHIEDETGPDMALLRVEQIDGQELSPIGLTEATTEEDEDVVVIGYPARDSRIPDQQLMIDIFGDLFDKKRLAPGTVTSLSQKHLTHDCSTLGGNSGSVVLDLKTGKAVGLHFAGRFLENNFAVPAKLIRQRMDKIKVPKPSRRNPDPSEKKGDRPEPKLNGNSLDYTIPIRINVSVGVMSPNKLGPSSTIRPAPVVTQYDEDEEEFITEGNPEEYADREGYDPDFLQENVPIPKIKSEARKKEILKFDINGNEEQELKYCHFSVVMNKNRRQCFFSACNIDGISSTSMKRRGWRLDPRIPKEMQIIKECYGDPPKFSRGHMTRREDPIWGDTDEATLGNKDSMHVTNAVPQMQTINAGIWLALENYALHNARKDDMRISVFTGPIFAGEDPIRFGVLIPRSFWKVIAFIHDETGELCATGYTLSQDAFIPEEEFVFGKHKTAQKSIASIEISTGLSFGNLKNLDPLHTEEEGFAPVALESLEQIRFF